MSTHTTLLSSLHLTTIPIAHVTVKTVIAWLSELKKEIRLFNAKVFSSH